MVYHDFLVAEAGFEAAMHNLTHDQVSIGVPSVHTC